MIIKGTFKHSDQTKEKMRLSHLGLFSKEKHPLWGKRGPDSPRYGKKHSEQTKQKMSESRKKWFIENNHPLLGKHHSTETKEKISGANWKGGKIIDSDGYLLVNLPHYPSANSNGYVPEHRLIWEKHYGKSIPKGFVIHHIDQNRANNKIENLMLLENSEHLQLHRRGHGRT